MALVQGLNQIFVNAKFCTEGNFQKKRILKRRPCISQLDRKWVNSDSIGRSFLSSLLTSL